LQEHTKATANTGKLKQKKKWYLILFFRPCTLTRTLINTAFFLDGQAGSKKTFLYSTIAHTVGGKGDSITPVAASLLAGGRNTHSTFKLSLLLNGTSTCNLNRNTGEANTLI
jgi:hypothetical protein